MTNSLNQDKTRSRILLKNGPFILTDERYGHCTPSPTHLMRSQRSTAAKKVLLDFSLTVKAAPHECVIRTSQP